MCIRDSFNTSRAGNFACVQILNEKSFVGVAPKRTVEVVAGANRIDFDVVGAKFKCITLGKTYASEFAARIRKVLVRTFKSRFGVDLNYICLFYTSQRKLLEEEGVVFRDDGTVDLDVYLMDF